MSNCCTGKMEDRCLEEEIALNQMDLTEKFQMLPVTAAVIIVFLRCADLKPVEKIEKMNLLTSISFLNKITFNKNCLTKTKTK